MNLDRITAPEFKGIEQIQFIKAKKETLNNNIPLYLINAGSQELIKIELIFSAGIWHQPNPLIAYTTNELLEEGTKKFNSAEIADKIDYYGSFLELQTDYDAASVSLYSLNKHLKSTFPILEEVIKNPTYPEREFNIFVQNKKQKLLVENQQVNRVARKKFMGLIFGANHPYGHEISEVDYNNLTTQQLMQFHNNYYSSDNCTIIVSGKISDQLIDLVNKHFGGNDWLKVNKEASHKKTESIQTTQQHKQLIYKDDALQSALRIGKPLFNKTHADYLPMLVLNTVLGGYFGSRLMANIREDKGYTYGIGSSIGSFKNAGQFVISSEVGVDVCTEAINEIFFEIKRLREEPISDEELQLVKNYMLGTFLRSVDGPFALADKLKGILPYGLGYDYYDKYISTIKNVTSKELQKLANDYLQEDSLIELVVGKKS